MRDRSADARGRRQLLAALVIGFACGSAPLQKQCLYDGRHYMPGESFPSVDGCATCSCTAGGVICGHRACPPDAGADARAGDASSPPGTDAATATDARAATDTAVGATDAGPGRCALDHTFRFHNDGGFVAYADSSTLTPPRTHVMSRDHFRNSLPAQCMRELPCDQPVVVDVVQIQQALAHPDVVTALATTPRPFFGTDTRPTDGVVFIFDRDDGRGFSVGSGNVPPGVRALANLLLRLQAETADTPACAGL